MKNVYTKRFCLLCGLCILNMCLGINVSAEQNPRKKLSPVIENARMATVDPDTGQLVSGEMVTEIMKRHALKAEVQKFMSSLRALMAADIEVSDLVERKVATGAVKVDLKGHFRTPLLATVNPDQTIAINHRMATSQENHHNPTEK